MKKLFKKHGVVKTIGAGLDILGLLLAVIAAFLSKFENVQLIMQLISCLLIFVGLFMMALMAENHKSLKLIGAIALSTIIFSWILPSGNYQYGEFADMGRYPLGLGDISFSLYYALNYVIEDVVFVCVIAGFYSVLTHFSGYQNLVTSLAKKLKGKEIVTALVMSLFTVALVAFTGYILLALIFIPFFVSVLRKMKVEKMATFAATYGSMLIGILGAIYGTDTLNEFNYYINLDVTTGLTYRAIIAAVAFVLYAFFLVIRIKNNKNNKEEELMYDPFEVEAPKKKARNIPMVITYVVLLALVVLGAVVWNNWKIEAFDNFHTWLTGLAIGKDFTLIKYILGQNAFAFGKFYLWSYIIILIIVSLILALIYKVKINDYLTYFYEGLKKAFKPALMIVGVYVIFMLAYISPFIPTIMNWAYGLTDSLNPIIASLMAFVTSIFYTDFGYTSYFLGQALTMMFADNLDIIHAIYTSMYGLVQVFMPASILLMFSLAMSKIDYKSWLKYIWLFVVGMMIILLVFFAVLVYV